MIRQQRKFLIAEKKNEIATVADLKTAQVVEWREDRLADGSSIRANTLMADRIFDYISGRDAVEVHQELRSWLANLIELGEYSKGIIFTPDGKIITSNLDLTPPTDHYLDFVSEAVKKRELVLTDYHSDTAGEPLNINLVIPILHGVGIYSRCIAVLILEIDPVKRLDPLIQSWPTASTTAETLLVKRDGDSVLFLNNPRHRKITSAPFHQPLANQNLPAARVAVGQSGSFEGTDYRNVRVFSELRIIPGTKWGLVAKIDVDEAMLPLSKSILMVTLVGVFVIVAFILGLFLWGVRRKAELLRSAVEIEHKHNLELKMSEASLTKSRDYHLKLLEIFPSLIWRSGTDARCDYFNQTWLVFTGRTLEQELGEGWAEGVHPEDLERCLSNYMEAFQNRLPFEMEYRLRFNDGSYHWINDHGRPYFDLDGNFAGYIGSCNDIDLQKRAESKLQIIHSGLEQQINERTSDLIDTNAPLRSEMVERKQLEQKLLGAKRLESIGQIAGGVAHEVRNPLNAILTVTEALFREKEIEANPEYKLYIHHIRTQVNRLVRLMNDLLDLGRTIPETNLRPVPLYELCRETVNLWKSAGISKNRRSLLSFDHDDVSIQVLADSLKLQQVFFNLLENAGHHSLESGRIMIRLAHNSPGLSDGMVAVQVIDLGSGIDEDKLSKVFDPFYTDRKEGTGLGLALVKHFIENMHGTVQIWNNTPPPGCTVEVCIPLYSEDSK